MINAQNIHILQRRKDTIYFHYKQEKTLKDVEHQIKKGQMATKKERFSKLISGKPL